MFDRRTRSSSLFTMIVSNICKNLCRSGWRTRERCSLGKVGYIIHGRLANHEESRRNSTRPEKCLFAQYRHYSQETDTGPKLFLPPLSDRPCVTWPSIFGSMRNLVVLFTVIKPRFDQEFNEAEFMFASKKAACVVSKYLVNEDYEALEGLVTADTIHSLKKKLWALSPEQKRLILVEDEDIYLSFLHDIAVRYEDDGDRQKRFVEISVVHHYMQGMKDIKKMDDGLVVRMAKYQHRLAIANYRFLREYTEGVDGSWILNDVNHFTASA